MMCLDEIGLLGLCEDKEYKYYLDDIGITLEDIAKITRNTGKELFERSLKLAWSDVIDNIKVNGFKMDKILSEFDYQFANGVARGGTYCIENECKYSNIYVQGLKFGSSDTGNLEVVLNGQIIFSDTIDNETISIPLDENYDEFELEINTDLDLYASECGKPFGACGYIICDASKYICKYANLLLKAVMYRTGAIILNKLILNPRYNDIVAYSEGNGIAKLTELDSELTPQPIQERAHKVGKFQKEMKRISERFSKLSRECDCCFDCESVISHQIVLP